MRVRPRTATAPLSAPRVGCKPISLLPPDSFPDLERRIGFGFGGHASGDGHYGPIHNDSGASLALDAFMHKTCTRPDSGCQSGAQPVRRHGVFHVHSHDMAFLDQWIGEMLDLRQGSTKSSSPTCTSSLPQQVAEGGRESLAHLYGEKAVRYGVVFDELVRQVAVHSRGLAHLVGKAFAGHHALLNRLIRVHTAREGELQRLQAHLRSLTGESNRKINEEDALLEEQQFMENLTKAELRETRALVSSMRTKLKYFGDEVARLRQIVLDKVDDDGVPRSERVHNSLTSDGVSMPVNPKAQKAIRQGKQTPGKEIQTYSEVCEPESVVTILALATEKMDMHAKHEADLAKLLAKLSTESSNQTNDIGALSKLIEGTMFQSFLKGINKQGRKARRVTRETQTRVVREDRGASIRPGTGSGGKKRPPKKTKGSKSEMLPLDLRNSVGMTSSPKKIPTLGYMLRTVLDMLLVWSRSLDTATSLCDKPGGMTEIAIKHFQLLHGMESTTGTMLAQLAAGLAHYADYKRCKVVGDLLGVDDISKPPPLDHRAALFLYRFLAELRSVGVFSEDISRERIVKILLNKSKVARAARTILGPLLPHGSPVVTVLIPCLQDSNVGSTRRATPGERGKRMTITPGEVPLAKQTVEFDDLLPEAVAAWEKIMKHRVSHIHLAFDQYCSTFQVTEEMRFATDEAPKARDAVVVQLSKTLVEIRDRRPLYHSEPKELSASDPMKLVDGIEQAQKERHEASALSGITAPERTMSWVLESSGEATCMKDYVSMNAPVVELMTSEDSALALQYLNPTLSQARVKSLYGQGCNIQRDNTHTFFRGLWVPEETDTGKKYWVHTRQDLTQWAVPFNSKALKREEIDRQAFVELCLSGGVLDESPLAKHFLGQSQALWDDWDEIVTTLGRKEMGGRELQGDSKRPAPPREPDEGATAGSEVAGRQTSSSRVGGGVGAAKDQERAG